MIKLSNLSMDYVDAVLVVDTHYMIVNSLRYNPRFDTNLLEDYTDAYIGKNFFEVYPELKASESSIAECLQTEKPVIRENQFFKDFKGKVFNTTNITLPIIKRGIIVGVIELSKDITSINDLRFQEPVKERKVFSDRGTKSAARKVCFHDILTNNKEMQTVIQKAKILSNLPNASLIYGETGTGKELLVQAMHNNGYRKDKVFIAQNCAALPETLFESILFGSSKGAYTGAENTEGLFELADGGTLFFDELNSMPYGLQAKLLRVLQDGLIRPIGSTKEKKVDVKVIAAMNADPLECIEKNVLREDLFYRFSSSILRVTPLRERTEDILLYTNHFMEVFNATYGKRATGLSKQLIRIFLDYKWPGNVRELKHIIESMISLSDESVMTIKHLPVYMQSRLTERDFGRTARSGQEPSEEECVSLNDALSKAERDLILRILSRTKGNLTKAGSLLRIPRQTLKYKILKHNINIHQFK